MEKLLHQLIVDQEYSHLVETIKCNTLPTLNEMGFSVRARKSVFRALQDIGIKCSLGEIGDSQQVTKKLLEMTGDFLLEQRSCGETTVNEIRERLSENGLRLNGI